jgi:hypothetical protein
MPIVDVPLPLRTIAALLVREGLAHVDDPRGLSTLLALLRGEAIEAVVRFEQVAPIWISIPRNLLAERGGGSA